jgi:hypothetical protein
MVKRNPLRALGIAALLTACGNAGTVPDQNDTSKAQTPIQRGTALPGAAQLPVANIVYDRGGNFITSSGMFVTRDWVVATKHGFEAITTTPNESFATIRQGESQNVAPLPGTKQLSVHAITLHPGTLDLAFASIETINPLTGQDNPRADLPANFRVPLCGGAVDPGTLAAMFGFGDDPSTGSGFGSLRWMITSFHSTLTQPVTITAPLNQVVNLTASPDNLVFDISGTGATATFPRGGDSGGPVFVLGQSLLIANIVGTNQTVNRPIPTEIYGTSLCSGTTGGNWLRSTISNSTRTSMNDDVAPDLIFSDVNDRRNAYAFYLSKTSLQAAPTPDGINDGKGIDGIPQQFAGDWELLGIADFNGDGEGDVVWRERSFNGVVIWLMDRDRNVTNVTGFVQPDPNWVPAALADVDGDLVSDIIWHNTVFDVYAFWIMYPLEGQTLTDMASTPANAIAYSQFMTGNPGFDLVGAGEFDPDELQFDTNGAQTGELR